MAPNFALSLSFDGIALLRRAVTGWMRLDAVALDSDDLDGALQALRDRALELAPDGAQVLLVLPNEQIRYLDLPDPGGDRAERETAVRAALDGATPYAVEELVFDWSQSGDRLLAAAVARETLEEADGFIRAHGFDPVSFTALPPEEAFEGPLFLGAAPGWTGAAPDRLPQPLRIVEGTPDLPWSRPRAEPQQPPAADAPPQPEPVAVPPAPPPGPAPKPTPTPVAPPPSEPARVAPPTAPAAPTAPVAPEPPARVSFGEGMFGPGGNARADTIPAPQQETPVLRPVKAPARTASGAPAVPLSGADTTAPGPAPSFSSIRATRDLPATPAAPAPASVSDAPRTAPRLQGPELPAQPARDATPATPAAPAPDRDSMASRALSALSRRRRSESAAPDPEPAPSADSTPHPEPAPRKTRAPARKASSKAAAMLKSPGKAAAQIAAMRRDPAPTPTPPPTMAPAAAGAAVLDPDEERRRMTVFGARREEQIGGKPRYLGLMLTAVLLLFLAGVAAWASVFLDEGLSRFFGPKDPAEEAIAAALPDEALPLPPPATEAEEEAEDTEMAALDPAPVQTDAATSALSQPILPQALTPEEAAARYAATGIWQRAPTAPLEPAQSGVDDLYIASVDPQVGQFDAVALPRTAIDHDDLAPQPVALPPGPDVRFDLDDKGLVRATPEGAVSPDGVRVFAGLPPQVPPLRGVAETPAAPEQEAAPQAAPAADPAQDQLRQLRPQPRPDDLVEQTERANLGGISIAELAGKRPAMRPPSAQEQAAEAQQDAPQQEPTAEAPAPATPPATALAVATSLQPQTRPRNMDTIVQRADRETVQTASAGPIRIQPGPKVPQNANVAKEATVRNQINLREMNLIGVFGKPSSRRALVRLSNGRLQNVKVGDRLDGGRVAAIGESELQLTKGGRNIVLRMPRG
ncbi:hypothetical protein M4578_02570 [Salipiger sp. P9]|uniref:hypothetical protein n=1 Tax=Salipiger pentaromativorans TaxID=2943193 RepID=UPI00215795C5|nr:hypothetical protein [Salipiger pentaromativorans]MCR8546699.1 hypothetical protein [Salipiger pentaromativorans]